MKQDNQPQNIDGQHATAEQIAMAKAKQKADALKRSKTNTRRTSQASTSNEQSQVTEQPPVMYQVPNINVPDNLHDCAKLIQGELEKIAQSQSVLLTLWEKVKSQVAGADSLTFGVPVTIERRLTINTEPSVGPIAIRASAPFGDPTFNTFTEVLAGGVLRWNYGAYVDMWAIYSYDETGAYLNQAFAVRPDGAGYLAGKRIATTTSLEEMRQALKLEIYAELATLNAGFVVPVVIPDNE